MIIIGFILGITVSYIIHKIDWSGIMYGIKERLYEMDKNRKKPIDHWVTGKDIFEWLSEQENYGVCNPPMDSNTFIHYVFEYLEIAPDPTPESPEQCNTYILMEILKRYSKGYKKEKKMREKLPRKPYDK